MKDLIARIEAEFPSVWQAALEQAKGDKLQAFIMLKETMDAAKTLGLIKAKYPTAPFRRHTNHER